MKAAHKPDLRIVAEAEAPSPEDSIKARLREIVPELLRAEQAVAELRNAMAEQGRRLAAERGVKFIRPEHLRAEFGEAR